MILLSLLGISILVALILAFIGDWRYAPEVNIGGSLLTFIVSLVLALQVYQEGGSIAGSAYFFVDYGDSNHDHHDNRYYPGVVVHLLPPFLQHFQVFIRHPSKDQGGMPVI